MSEQQIKLIRKESRTDLVYYVREHGVALLHILIPMFLVEAEKILLKQKTIKKDVDKRC